MWQRPLLGAPEAVTDARGRVLWRAHYSPFGAARISTDRTQPFTLELRLPGQVFDAETGLHYNRQRYYDPALGQYLTPDPLGTPDGPNPYAYVAYNPLGYIDPDGLVLFAFDGTQNGDPPKGSRTLSNVVQFYEAYQDGERKYVAGVGANHLDAAYGSILTDDYFENIAPGGIFGSRIPDQGGNYSAPDRIARMLLYFTDSVEAFKDEYDADTPMDIDIIGFSRGAANARHFANLLVDMMVDDTIIRYQKHDQETGQLIDEWACQAVNFRFMGLFDTVLSTNRSDIKKYRLDIPSQFEYVAQAVALNEYRYAPTGEDAFWTAPVNIRFWNETRIHLEADDHYGAFPLESIGASFNTPGQVRIERGFIGAHADIGGGYSMQNGDNNYLSTVALSWMVGQAQIAGVNMDASGISINMRENVYMHDQSNAIRFGNPNDAPEHWEVNGQTWTYTGAEDREVRGGLGGGTQRTQTFGSAEAGGNRSMTNDDTHEFITYLPRRPSDLVEGTRKNPRHDTRPTNDIPGLQGLPHVSDPSNITGIVDMQGYVGWLRDHGYAFAGSDQW